MSDRIQPLATFVEGKVEDNYYSQDMPMILAKRRHLLFVYGTLKRGFFRHNLLLQKKPTFVGDAWTVGNYFNMLYTNTQHPYPVILPTYGTEAKGKIHGEVYLVHPETIVQCDFYESNGAYYDRVRARVEITNANNPDTPLSIDAWLYEGNKEYWDIVKTKQRLRQADPLTRKKDGAKYFTFMKKYANGKPNASLRSM